MTCTDITILRHLWADLRPELDQLLPEQQWQGHKLCAGLGRAPGGWRHRDEDECRTTSIASVNGNCWRTIEAVVDWRSQEAPKELPLAWCFQEHRIKEVAGLWWATKWCKARGYHTTAVKAVSTGPARSQSSAGTAVASKASVTLGEWPAWGGKAMAREDDNLPHENPAARWVPAGLGIWVCGRP